MWLPLVPNVMTKLQNGARVADVGCGRGRALTRLATAFPESRFVGYEIYGPNVDRAMENVRAAGLSDGITIRHADASEGLSGRYDLVTHSTWCMTRSIHAACCALFTTRFSRMEPTCAWRPTVRISRSRIRVQSVRSSRDAAYCCA